MTHPIRCSFCGKERDAVRLLIAGPNVCICNECVALCADIVIQAFARTSCPTIEAPTAPTEETPCPT